MELILNSTSYTLCTKAMNKINFVQKAIFDKSINLKNYAYNYGSNYDKWSCSLTFDEFEVTVVPILKQLNDVSKQVTLIPNEGELICGPGIDYSTNTSILANITTPNIKSKIKNYAYSELSLDFDILGFIGVGEYLQPVYKNDVLSVLPDSIAYQYNLTRNLKNSSVSMRADKFGNFGLSDITDSTGNSITSDYVEVTIKSNESDAAQIGKFYSIQRTDPFLWPDSNAPFFVNNQDTTPVIISKFEQSRLSFNNWSTKLTLLGNTL